MESYMEGVRTPAKPLVCFRIAGKWTPGLVCGPMRETVGWLAASGHLVPDACGWFGVGVGEFP